MSNASVSVIIPCYRSRASITRAIESVYNQTMRPTEVILVDDCSPDDTLDKLYEEQKKYPSSWVKVIALSQNVGPGNARNAGWEQAVGRYVAFLDSDDCWHPRKVELQYQWLEGNPDVSLLGQCFGAGLRDEPQVDSVLFTEVGERQLLFSNRFTTSSVMLRRDIESRFKHGKRFCEDYHLWSDILFSGGRCFNMDFPLVRTFKPVYGDSGLSGQLWSMEKGELGVHVALLRAGRIGVLPFCSAVTWSLLKFIRRIINSSLRRN